MPVVLSLISNQPLKENESGFLFFLLGLMISFKNSALKSQEEIIENSAARSLGVFMEIQRQR